MKSFKQFLIEQGILGPHEGKELELMLNNKKPAALIATDKDMEKFRPYIESGKFVSKTIPHPYMPTQKMNFVGQTEDHLNRAIGAFRNLWKYHGTDNQDAKDAAHTELGRALGYSEDDIKVFLKKIKGQ